MFGWRARIGIIAPSVNTTVEPEYKKYAPEGISIHTTRARLEQSRVDEIAAMEQDLGTCAELLSTADVDVVAFACTTGSLVEGEGYSETIIDRLETRSGVPGITTASAVIHALEALNLNNLAVTTPYIPELNERVEEFIEAHGFSVDRINGLSLSEGTASGSLFPQTAFKQAKKIDSDEVDGVFISCTNYRTFEIIEILERDLNKPVVTSNQATLWEALRVAGVNPMEIELGSLFQM